MEKKEYLGDGVYVAIDRGMIRLTTENGITETNKIFLEGPVIAQLLRYMTKLGIDIAALYGKEAI